MICTICEKTITEEDVAVIKSRVTTASKSGSKTYLSTVVKVICKKCYAQKHKVQPEKINAKDETE